MTVFSFAFIIPILQVIFGLERGHYEFRPWNSPDIIDTVTNNFYYFTGHVIDTQGPSKAHALLGVKLIVITLDNVKT